MFTGIIEHVGTVRGVSPREITVDTGPLAEGIAYGDSVCVSGVCLTATRIEASIVRFDVSAETAARSALKELRTGAKVNLERAMRADGRFGGHIVQGHIDGIGKIAKIRDQGEFAEFTFEASAELLDEMVVKGSVAVDGISLTIARMDERSFTVALIPTTLGETTWKHAKLGDTVNIETDILCKIIKKQLRKMTGGPLSMDKLREMGFC